MNSFIAFRGGGPDPPARPAHVRVYVYMRSPARPPMARFPLAALALALFAAAALLATPASAALAIDCRTCASAANTQVRLKTRSTSSDPCTCNWICPDRPAIYVHRGPPRFDCPMSCGHDVDRPELTPSPPSWCARGAPGEALMNPHIDHQSISVRSSTRAR